MPRVSMAQNPDLTRQMLAEVDRVAPREGPQFHPPAQTTYPLCGGYLDGGGWADTFEVRELTGRDEEYFGRIGDGSRTFMAILERGLVRVGSAKSSQDVLDQLLACDWETILLAIRIVTFGQQYTANTRCGSCGSTFEATVDLDRVPCKSVHKEDRTFDVIGRHGTVYQIMHPFGSTQRKVLNMGPKATEAEITTLLLSECVQSVNGVPMMGPEVAKDIPLSDRRTIMREMELRRGGPQFGEVKEECPSCGADQVVPISIAALFQ